MLDQSPWYRTVSAAILLLVGAISGLASPSVADQKGYTTALGPDGLPRIFWMIKQNDVKGISTWIEAGGDIEAHGYHGATPVLSAALIDNWLAVHWLLENGARATVVDRRGYTLAFLAQRSRVTLDGQYGQALIHVRSILTRQGLMGEIYQPETAKRMLEDGDWPPPEYR
jgi:hypothetical protein